MSDSGFRGVVFGLLSGTFGCAPSGGSVALVIVRDKRFISVTMGSRNVNVSGSGISSVFRHFAAISGRGSVRPSSNVKLSLIGRLIGVLRKRVRIRDRMGGKDMFGLILRGKGRVCTRSGGIRCVLGSASRRRRAILTRPRRGSGVSLPSVPPTAGRALMGIVMIRSGTRLHRFVYRVLSNACHIIKITSKIVTLRGVRRRVPSFVVASVVVPHVSNVRLVERVGRGIGAYSVPLVVLSTGSSIRSHVRYLRLKVSSCVPGPFDDSCLGSEVRGLVEREGILRSTFLSGCNTRPGGRPLRTITCPISRVIPLSRLFVRGLMKFVRRGCDGPKLQIGSLTRFVGVDHSMFGQGIGNVVKVSPVRCVGGCELGGTGDFVRDNVSFSRITFTINFSSPNCFNGTFGGTFGRALARCGGGGWIPFYTICRNG